MHILTLADFLSPSLRYLPLNSIVRHSPFAPALFSNALFSNLRDEGTFADPFSPLDPDTAAINLTFLRSLPHWLALGPCDDARHAHLHRRLAALHPRLSSQHATFFVYDFLFFLFGGFIREG